MFQLVIANICLQAIGNKNNDHMVKIYVITKN